MHKGPGARLSGPHVLYSAVRLVFFRTEFADLSKPVQFAGSRDALVEAMIQLLEFLIQAFGKMRAEFGKVLAD